MDTPQLNQTAFRSIDHAQLSNDETSPLKIALLYGSLKENCFYSFASGNNNSNKKKPDGNRHQRNIDI